MIASVCQAPKGVIKVVPAEPERPKDGGFGGDSDEELEDQAMQVDTSGTAADEVAHALVAVQALRKNKGSSTIDGFDGITKALQDIMAGYDEGDDGFGPLMDFVRYYWASYVPNLSGYKVGSNLYHPDNAHDQRGGL